MATSSITSQSQRNRTIKLFLNGSATDDSDGIEMLLEQVTPRTVSSLFKLDINTVWLRDELGSKAYFPDRSTGGFLFGPEVGNTLTSLTVEGSPSVGSSSLSVPQQSSTPSSYNLPGPSGVNTRFCQQKKEGRCNVKIIQAEMELDECRRPSFNKLGQVFIDVTEATANIHYITSVVQQKFGSDHYVVTGDGLKIEDSSGTQGLRFWKVGSRKLYAVKRKEKPAKRLKRAIEELDDNSLSPSESLLSEVKELRSDIAGVMKLTKDSKLPPGLKLLICETFKCAICHGIIHPPVAYTRCCRSIAGCENCFDTLYGGDDGRTKCCPLCRRERASNEISRLNGLNDFLEGVQVFFHDDDDAVDDDYTFTFPP